MTKFVAAPTLGIRLRGNPLPVRLRNSDSRIEGGIERSSVPWYQGLVSAEILEIQSTEHSKRILCSRDMDVKRRPKWVSDFLRLLITRKEYF